MFRVPLPLPSDALVAVNVYVIVEADQLVLVDGGWALQESEEQLSRSLDRLGFGITDITQFLVTHIHRDHYSQALSLRRVAGATVALGEGERQSLAELLASWERGQWSYRSGGRLIRAGAHALYSDMLAFVQNEPVERYELPDIWLDDSMSMQLTTRKLDVVSTPGHTAGHVVFVDPMAGLTFAGDHILPHITPSIGLEQAPTQAPLADYLSSLAKVRSMPDSQLLPAHGPTAPSVHARVDELLAHHEQRLSLASDAVARGGSTGLDVAEMLRWTRREHRLTELDQMNRAMAVAETLAHLDVLVTQGRLSATRDAEGADHFEVV